MTKTVFLILLLAMVGLAAPQQAGVAPDREARAVRTLSRKLALTAEQQNQILNIFRDHRQEMESVKNDASLTPKQQRIRLKQARSDRDQKMNGVLTPDQQTAYEQLKTEMRERAIVRKQTSVN